MKVPAKLIFILSLLLVVVFNTALAQNKSPTEDEEFNLFLFALASIFVCAMIGAAIIGATVAALVLFFLFALIAIGAVSTSVAVGLYKRSYHASFRTFLIIIFGFSCAVIGGVGSLLFNIFLHLPLSNSLAIITGSAAGIIGGYIMAAFSFKIFLALINYLTKRLNIAQ